MSESDLNPVPGSVPPAAKWQPFRASGWRAELPYIVMLLAAFVGTATSSVGGRPLIVYWEILVPVYALICVLAGWKHVAANADRLRLIWTQALHWLACLIAMRMLFMPELRGVMNDNATGLTLLTVLALGTFLAGLTARTWQIGVVGALLALAVPAAAWLEQSALLLFGEAVLVFAAGGLFIWARSRWPRPDRPDQPAARP